MSSRELRHLERAIRGLGTEVEKIKVDQRAWLLALVAAFVADILVHLFVSP